MFSDRLRLRLEDKFEDERAQYELERIGDAAQRMKRMIDSLLVLSRVGQGAPRLEHMQLSELVKEVKESMSTLIAESDAEIEITKDGKIDADHEGLAIVLQNLFTNAIRYAKPGIPSQIRVELTQEREFYQLRVIDNGIGIAAEQGQRIFEPFVRMAGKDVPGSGIGLAICRRAIDRHFGSISVDTADEGGSVFTILIPVSLDEAGNALDEQCG